MDRITKTEYPECDKVVLDDNITTGIMISTEHYDELIAAGLNDEEIFEGARY